jgi:hypothetical protein
MMPQSHGVRDIAALRKSVLKTKFGLEGDLKEIIETAKLRWTTL